MKILLFSIIFIIFSGLLIPSYSYIDGSPYQQWQDDVPWPNTTCKDGLELVFKNNGLTACVKSTTAQKLLDRGWAIEIVDKKHCFVDVDTSHDIKYDSGLREQILKMLDEGISREYGVLLWVADENKSKVKNILKHCHDASQTSSGKILSFVTAKLPLQEILKISAYGEIGKIGAGELFVIPVKLEKIEGKTWVQIDPIQCAGNPWEKYWLESHDGEYPRVDEAIIIKSYYEKEGIIIFNIQSEATYQVTCEGCGCPRGDTLYLQVSNEDVNKMLQLGFKVSTK